MKISRLDAGGRTATLLLAAAIALTACVSDPVTSVLEKPVATADLALTGPARPVPAEA